MAAVDSPQAARRAGDALIITRIWGGFIAVCHLGGLAGAVAPLFVHTTSTSASPVLMASVSVAYHVVALVAAVMLLIGLRSARFALLLTIGLSAAHCVSLISTSAIIAAVGFGFGLFLYVPPLVLIYWRPEEFR
jgi:hypothetical protein